MKFKFIIQPYQTEAVESVTNVFAGQTFNDRFTYRRDVQIERDVTNWMMTDEELYLGFANARVQLDFGQLRQFVLILKRKKNCFKDKERLLSFNNPVRLIFSHSALREGWV